MTTTTISQSYQFNAAIQSKGKQRNSDGWTLTLDWKLPGSKFELILYGQDWEEVEGYDVGDSAYLDIAQGSLKEGKSGRYASDYFWNLTAIDVEHPEAASKPKAPAPAAKQGAEAWQNPPVEYARNQAQDAIQTRIAWNSAINNATNMLAVQWKQTTPRAELMREAILDWAGWYYEAITAGPPSQMPIEAPSVPAQPPEEPQPSQKPPQAAKAPQTLTPAAIKKRIIDGPLAQWNADIAAGARNGQMLTVKFLADWAKAKHDLDLDNLTRDQSIIVANAIANGLVK